MGQQPKPSTFGSKALGFRVQGSGFRVLLVRQVAFVFVIVTLFFYWGGGGGPVLKY